MIKISEEIRHAGIEIERGRINPELALALSDDCARLLEIPHAELHFDFEYDPVAPDSPAAVYSRNYRLKHLLGSRFSALKTVLELHPYKGTEDANVIVNRQEPGGMQVFHPDIVAGIQQIVHASPNGAFDFFPDAVVDRWLTLELNAGDVVTLNRPSINHRGRNPSDLPRFTLVLSSGGLVY